MKAAIYCRVSTDNRELPADVKLRLCWLELIHRAEVQVAAEHAERKLVAEAEYQSVLWRDLVF